MEKVIEKCLDQFLDNYLSLNKLRQKKAEKNERFLIKLLKHHEFDMSKMTSPQEELNLIPYITFDKVNTMSTKEDISKMNKAKNNWGKV